MHLSRLKVTIISISFLHGIHPTDTVGDHSQHVMASERDLLFVLCVDIARFSTAMTTGFVKMTLSHFYSMSQNVSNSKPRQESFSTHQNHKKTSDFSTGTSPPEIGTLQHAADQQRLGDKADDLHLCSAVKTSQRFNSPSQFLLTTYRLFGKS